MLHAWRILCLSIWWAARASLSLQVKVHSAHFIPCSVFKWPLNSPSEEKSIKQLLQGWEIACFSVWWAVKALLSLQVNVHWAHTIPCSDFRCYVLCCSNPSFTFTWVLHKLHSIMWDSWVWFPSSSLELKDSWHSLQLYLVLGLLLCFSAVCLTSSSLVSKELLQRLHCGPWDIFICSLRSETVLNTCDAWPVVVIFYVFF